MVLTPDMINGLFELFGSAMLWTNVRQLHKDKEIKGINWWTVVFFTSWGIWNLFYYPSLNQMWSFYGGISIALANVTWLGMLLWYKFNKRKALNG